MSQIRKTIKRLRLNQGFTLLELLVVLGILSLIAAVAAPRLIKHFSKAKTDTALLQINNLSSAVEMYFLDVGRYPTQEAGLSALMKAPDGEGGWNGPYLKKQSGLKDPWKRPYHYRFPGEHGDFDIFSLGRDGQDGGDGEDRDVVSW